VRPKPIRPDRFAWAYPAEPPFEDEARPLLTGPAVGRQGHIYACLLNRLVALEEDDGKAKVLWEYVTGSPAPGATVVGPDENIRVHCSDGFLHCVTPEGKQAWSPAQVGQPLGSAAPIVDEQGNTLISAFGGGLLRVDANGKVGARPYFRSRRILDSAGVVRENVLYIGSEDGYVFAIELTGSRGTNLWDHADERGYTGWYVNSSPAITDEDMLVVAARDEYLYGFKLDGAKGWETKIPGQMLGSPVVDASGHVYVGTSQTQRGRTGRGLLVCVDGNSHKIRWEYEAAGPVESTPVIGDDGLIYFGDNDGTIHAVDNLGKGQWTAKVEAPIRSALAMVAPKRLAVGLENETLVVLECSAEGLASGGWPKIRSNPGQCGLA
jgi:outer membrane protein assembly factor BamB